MQLLINHFRIWRAINLLRGRRSAQNEISKEHALRSDNLHAVEACGLVARLFRQLLLGSAWSSFGFGGEINGFAFWADAVGNVKALFFAPLLAGGFVRAPGTDSGKVSGADCYYTGWFCGHAVNIGASKKTLVVIFWMR